MTVGATRTALARAALRAARLSLVTAGRLIGPSCVSGAPAPAPNGCRPGPMGALTGSLVGGMSPGMAERHRDWWWLFERANEPGLPDAEHRARCLPLRAAERAVLDFPAETAGDLLAKWHVAEADEGTDMPEQLGGMGEVALRALLSDLNRLARVQ